MSNPCDKARDRLLAIAQTLQSPDPNYGLPQEFMTKLRAALVADPLLPRADPSVSLWQEPPHPSVSNIQSPSLPRFADFVVIGSGITGCSVTKSLLEDDSLHPASRVVVLEARTLTSGATGRNGGQLVSPVGHTYSALCRRHGEDAAKEISRFSLMNIDRVMSMVKDLDPELQAASEIRKVSKVMVSGDKETWEVSRKSLDAFRDAIPEHRALHGVTEKEDLAELNIKNGFGVIQHQVGALWPYRLITGIFERLLAQHPGRLSIETNTPATNVKFLPESESEYPYAIETPRGTIRSKQVIHCTNANAAHLLRPLAGRLYPYRGPMSVQKAGPYLEHRGNQRSWSCLVKSKLDPVTGFFHSGLYYLQQHGTTGDIWVGTDYSNLFDVLTSDDTSVPGQAVEALLRFLPEYFTKGWPTSELPELKGVWTGLQGHTSDGIPLVGRLTKDMSGRDGDGEWFAGGYSGYGMDKAWMTGEALCSMITRDVVPDWLPKAFLMTKERLQQDVTVEKSVAKWVSIAKTGDW
ncbi:hypothetical protein NCS57_00661900 [Fusarium keratoplasticum]|uniref:Uncharacterized protein n=1 Tax=Fusarium keratoplasticum TaxID=1328300 RepID=A0ACC0R5I3_9HYPO|nr:hypothetical protein NCS57_00661900 [Fusarium keratoplasticum]KAI8671855.1 hypothetical protein NCS57_00661900 [Fusarium keratoplasticum]KAI8679071.1 hypothetical protein NCS55_00630100 [Fusarium keratoplasticum]